MFKVTFCIVSASVILTSFLPLEFEREKSRSSSTQTDAFSSKQSLHFFAAAARNESRLNRTSLISKVDETSNSKARSNDAKSNASWFRSRHPIPKLGLPFLPKNKHLLTVKFHDELHARAVAGSVAFSYGTSRFFSESEERELKRIGVRFEQLVQLPQETLTFLEMRGAIMSGDEQPDLAGMFRVDAPDHLVNQLAISLFLSDEVEWIDFMEINPKPPACDEDIPPVTPNYTNLQGYRGPNPGLNMSAFWEMGFARGLNVKLADCEYGCNLTHEDLCDIIPEPNQTPTPQVYTNGWHQHGTAVLGEILGGDNAYGVSGLSPEVQGYIFPEWTVQGGSRRTTCILNAIAAMLPGDVVLLEMQTTFPGTSGFGPAETSLPVWTAVKNGVDGGVVVVGAAGNGNQNLDAPEYASYIARGDSGAIIVGAGTNTTAHSKLSFSTYGNRVNVQGWGQSVFSTGYGDFATIGGDANQTYTSTFSGTSSASPFIAASCASLQSYAVADIGRRLTPQELRQVFLNSGWPQTGGGGNIGKFPNLVEAANYISQTWGPEFSLPAVLFVDMGNAQGGLADVNQPDDLRLLVDAVVPDRNPIREANSLAVQITVRIPVPNSSPSSWGLRTEGHCNAENIIQRVEIYNYALDNYQLVSTSFAPVGADKVTRTQMPVPITPFIDPATNRIRARVTFSEHPNATAINWRVFMDQMVGFFND